MDCHREHVPGCRAQGSRARTIVLVSVVTFQSSLSPSISPSSYLPARIGDLATSLTNCTRKKTISNGQQTDSGEGGGVRKRLRKHIPFKLITSLILSSLEGTNVGMTKELRLEGGGCVKRSGWNVEGL